MQQEAEIELRSVVSDDFSKIFVEIDLPVQQEVGFELFTADNQIIHYWHNQPLDRGEHFLKLDLPTLESGRYLLKIIVSEDIYKHLVFIQ